MTREEATKAFEEIRANAQTHLGKKYAAGCEGYYRDKLELADAALTALRGPTREKVERMRGTWKHYLPPLGAGNVQCRCTNCGRTPDVETPFCAWCGSPMTDEAVDMVLRRWTVSRTLLDLVSELNTLNDDNLAERVIKDSDVQWCLFELQDILEVEQPTLTPQNERVSVEDTVPDPGERVLATDGIFVGEAYRTSADSWHRHTGFPWRDGVTGRTVKYWMLLPAPPDRRPPGRQEGHD